MSRLATSRAALIAGALVIAAPALAQDVQDPPAPPPGEQVEPSAAEIEQAVRAEFPRRDADGNGALDQTEFGAWIGPHLAQSPAPEGAPDHDARIAQAFARADANGDGSISQTEMATFLAQPH